MAISRLAKDIANHLIEVGLIDHSWDDIEAFGEDEDDLLREIQKVITRHSRSNEREATPENG